LMLGPSAPRFWSGTQAADDIHKSKKPGSVFTARQLR
jgi:hypothetical protein